MTIILFYDPERLTALLTLPMQFGPQPVPRAGPSDSSALKPTSLRHLQPERFCSSGPFLFHVFQVDHGAHPWG